MSVNKDKKTGKWYCRVSYKDDDGKYKQKTKKGFDTKKEAQIYEAELTVILENCDEFNKEDIIFADYFEEWARKYKIGIFSDSTDKKYEYDIKLVHQFFGKKKLKDITRNLYQDFLNERGEGNGKDIVEKTHGRIKSCMQDALHDGLIKKDPTYRAVIRYDIQNDDKLKYWSEKEFQKILQYLQGNMSQANLALYITALTGLRIGEVYGLSWDDIGKDKLSVKRGFDYKTNKFTDGKTKSSIRTISITDNLYKEIIKYKLNYQKTYNQYLFVSMNRPFMTYNGLRKNLKRICNELKVENLTIHSFRHSHCS